MTDALAFASITALAEAYRRGEATPSAAVEACIARSAALDDEIGAWQARYDDDARLAAEGADRALRSGHVVGPFQGVPFALKDIVDVEGRVTTGGSAARRDRVSPASATIARRLVAAGGILLGKTRTVEHAMGGWGTNQHMGTPWNPWDPRVARAPGGSSSGSGASVAAGMATCAVGTDTGGSVRLPAAWCGIVGLKVTEGRLPTDGIIALSHTLDTPGPMARSVEDCVLMLEAMLGREPLATERDWRRRDGLFAAVDAGARGLRLGCLAPAEREGVDPEILALYDAALERLRALGAQTTPFALPISFEAMRDRTGAIISVEGYHHHGALYEDRSAPLDEDVRARFLAGREVRAHDYVAALRARLEDRAMLLDRMRGLDAILTPTVATPPVPVADIDQRTTPARFTRAGNYLGLCALSVPSGLTASGLPGALQVIGRPGDEAMAVRIGAAFERDRGPMPRPPMS
ncbi:MAG: amidase [Ectothiorhodospiraceae bacterium]|nr:amidase [Chromatiales bacterium]MCP5156346.1 amidase [Ectothiorhodospiraceae bacterium]